MRTPSSAIFCTSPHNYDYDTALTGSAAQLPYGTNGFIVVHKGGDAAVFKEGQAIDAGWAKYGTVYDQRRPKVPRNAGVCDPTNAPAPGDPAVR